MTSLSGSNSADGKCASMFSPWDMSLWVCLFLVCLMSSLSACNVASSWLQQQPKVLSIKASVAPICTIPMAHSYCSGVNCGIPVVDFLSLWMYELFLYFRYTCSCCCLQGRCNHKKTPVMSGYNFLYTLLLRTGCVLQFKFLKQLSVCKKFQFYSGKVGFLVLSIYTHTHTQIDRWIYR